MRLESDRLGRERARAVKAAMEHAWTGYEQYAYGADELQPRSKRGKEAWGGMGVTLVDSLGGLLFFFLFFCFFYIHVDSCGRSQQQEGETCR